MYNEISLREFAVFIAMCAIPMLFALPSLYKSDKKGSRVLFWIIITVFEPIGAVNLGMKIIESNEVLVQKYSFIYSILGKINFGLLVLCVIEYIMLYRASDMESQARQRKVYKILFTFLTICAIFIAVLKIFFDKN